jgi:Ca2+-binding EF-hand superfamily protein
MRDMRHSWAGFIAGVVLLAGLAFPAQGDTGPAVRSAETTGTLRTTPEARARAQGISGSAGFEMRRPQGNLMKRAPHDIRPWGLFRSLDRDRDGKVSTEEIEKAEVLFKSLDTNGDGVIAWDRSLSEKPVQRKSDKEIQGFFRRRDVNKDGKLTAEELGVDEARIREMDTNGEGSVSAEEFLADTQKVQDRMERDILEDRRVTQAALGALDADGDGKITRSEFAGFGALLRNQDQDKKGFVAREDMLRLCPADTKATSGTLPAH